jgi:Phosphoglucomutase/phosphomannomutase, alpha/beta/alpha domain I
VNPSIFREYDIRGLAEKDFDKEFALLLGKAHGTMVCEKGGRRVTVGRDCRATSDTLRPLSQAWPRRVCRSTISGFVRRRCSIFLCFISTSMAGFR